MIFKSNVKLAGWLSVLSAVLLVPLIFLKFIIAFSLDTDIYITYFSAILTALYTVFFMYIYSTLRTLLKGLGSCDNISKLISIVIWIATFIAVIDLCVLPTPKFIMLVNLITYVLLIPLGVIYTILGFKLLNCTNDLFAYSKPLSYLIIVVGISTALVVTVMFGLLLSIAVNILLAIMFFSSKKTMS